MTHYFKSSQNGGIKDNLPLALPPTLCRLENRIDRKTLSEIAKVFVEIFIASYITPPDTLVLDFDPTAVRPRHACRARVDGTIKTAVCSDRSKAENLR
jgi:hypothetical protein